MLKRGIKDMHELTLMSKPFDADPIDIDFYSPMPEVSLRAALQSSILDEWKGTYRSC